MLWKLDVRHLWHNVYLLQQRFNIWDILHEAFSLFGPYKYLTGLMCLQNYKCCNFLSWIGWHSIIILTLIWGYSVRISAGTPAILTEIFRSFSKSLQVNSDVVPRSGPNGFLQNTFHFIRLCFCHSPLCFLAIDIVVKYPREVLLLSCWYNNKSIVWTPFAVKYINIS
jgi:hypothetical protein